MSAPDPYLSIPPPPPSHQEHDHDDNYVPRIFGLVVVAVFFMFLLHVLGSLRRMTSNRFLHSLVFAAYTLSYTLVGYTLGLMNSSRYYVDEFPVWAVCLLLLLGSTDSLTACSLDDIDNWKTFHAKHILKGAMVVYIVIEIAFLSEEPRYLQAPLWAILFVIILKSYARMTSMKSASKSHMLFKDIKPIADYMQHEHLHQQPDERPDPITMKGYRYIVTGEHRQKYHVKRPEYINKYIDVDGEKDVKIITVEQIWQCEGSMMRSESRRGLRLKDLCLSMALSKMLNRRFGDFDLPEAGLPKTHDFVFRGLLTGDNPHERAFRVIEAELAFVHDIYYTRYPYHYKKGRFFALYLPIAMVSLCLWLTYVLFKHPKTYDEYTTVDITLFLMVVVTFLEVFQLYLHMASGWFKVELVRAYVTRIAMQSTFSRMIIGLLLSLKALRPWQNKLGQYSLLHKFKGKTRISSCFHYATFCLVNKGKNGRNRCKSVKLSEQVKKAVIDSLIKSDGHLTNGIRSLRNNGVPGQLISWTCDTRNTVAAHTILIWHIATTLCKHELDAQAKEKKLVEFPDEDRSVIDKASSVALDLSQYCAYLIAFAPNLLPDHNYVSSFILDQSIKEAQELLKGAKTMESKYKKLMSINDTDDPVDASLIVLGARLARELNRDIQSLALRWKLLSEFWAEMVLYVAPSEDTRGHLEAMPRGGEFVTHLWALLTHAGVLKRDTAARLAAVV